LLAIPAAAQEVAVDEPLDVGVKVCLRLLDDEECVIALAIRDKLIEL
jgi:hypothetical protein